MSLIYKQISNYSRIYDSILTHPFNYNSFLLNQVMFKKKRRKVEKIIKTDEQKQTSSINVIRRQDLLGNPETSESISKSIKHQLNLVSNGFVTRKHISRLRKYKALRTEGKTHDNSYLPSDSFVTPLTMLQHESSLPITLNHTRHNFPHSFHYKVDWYGSSTPAPHPSDNMCYVSFNFNELNLTSRQIDGLKDILGPKRVDYKSGICVLESNIFDSINQNASYLGDITEKLIKIVKRLH